MLGVLFLCGNHHLSFSKTIVAISFGFIQPFYFSRNFHSAIFDIEANLKKVLSGWERNAFLLFTVS
jgi:hypothetical protein